METRSLSVPLSDEDFKLRAHALASAIKDRDVVESSKKAANERFKGELESFGETISRLSTIVKNKAEFRPVECDWISDHKESMMRLIRIDTGTEVDSRPMTHSERQVKLFPVGAKKDDKKAVAGAKKGKGDGPSDTPTAA